MGDNYAKDQRKSIRHNSAHNDITAHANRMAEAVANAVDKNDRPTCNRRICSFIGYCSVYFS